MPKTLTLIVIRREDRDKVDQIVNNNEIASGSTYLEGEIVGVDGSLFEKSKKHKKREKDEPTGELDEEGKVW